MTRGLVLIPAALWDALSVETRAELSAFAASRRVAIRAHLSMPEEALRAVTREQIPSLVRIAAFGLSSEEARGFRMPAASATRRYLQVIPLPMPASDRVEAWIRKAVGFVGD